MGRSKYSIHTIPIAALGHIHKATSHALQEAWSTAKYMDLMPPDTLLAIMTTDGGANYRKGSVLLVGSDSAFVCICHRLSNAVEAAQKECDCKRAEGMAFNLFGRISAFVNFVHASPHRGTLFQDIQEIYDSRSFKLVTSVVTRWFSQAKMTQRYLAVLDDVKRFIREGHANEYSTNPDDFVIADEEIKQLQDILVVLKKLEDVCTFAETITKPTLVWVCQWIA